MKKGKIYLIPNTLGGPAAEVTTPQTKEAVKHIRHFIVEELRSARRLLRAIGYETDFEEVEFILLNEHTKPDDNRYALIEPALKGNDMGIISEAGVPCVADPGALAVRLAHETSVKVVPLVGANSILMALMASGLNGQSFAFHGYLPKEKSERIKKIKLLESIVHRDGQTQMMMDAPYRNESLFEDLMNTLSPKTMICVAADIATDTEQISTRSVEEWKSHPPKLHKRPVMFAIGR